MKPLKIIACSSSGCVFHTAHKDMSRFAIHRHECCSYVGRRGTRSAAASRAIGKRADACCCTQEREGGMSPANSQWPGNHADERPEFYETLEASIKHVWLDKSSYETYAKALGAKK